MIFIAGPTASGKSGLALATAKMLRDENNPAIDMEIINADAIQVYRDLHILSARPHQQEQDGIKHHLYGYKDGAQRCSAGIWAKDALRAINDIHAKGRGAILVGGTGLYFAALEHGLSPIPDIDDQFRLEAKAHYDKLGAQAFYEEVVSFDGAMKRLEVGDRQRLMRAWSVHRATGKPLSYFQALPREPLLEIAQGQRVNARIILLPEREALYERCNARYDKMLLEGGIEEARTLLNRGLSPDLPVMKALGAAELVSHLRGEISLDNAIDLAKRNTRRFAKRQITWFKGQTPDWPQGNNAKQALLSLHKQLQ